MIKAIYSSLYKKLKKQALVFGLKGSNFECNCCGYKAAIFLPAGNRIRLNAVCPQCGSKERHRSYYIYLQNRTDLFSKDRNAIRLLHIAPEKFFFDQLSFNKTIQYYPGDRFDPGYKYPKGTINMDITDLKFDDNFFDAIICNHVLEHVPDEKKALSELHRVLKPSGWALLQSPIDTSREITYDDPSIVSPEERLKHFGQKDHVRIYGRDYPQRLSAAGFQVKGDSYLSTLPEELIRKCVLSREEVFFCIKP